MNFSGPLSRLAFLMPLCVFVGIRLGTYYLSCRLHFRTKKVLLHAAKKKIEKLLSDLVSAAALCDAEVYDGSTLKIYLNCDGLGWITVPRYFMIENNWSAKSIFDVYCMLFDARSTTGEDMTDAWNCLCAIIEAHLGAVTSGGFVREREELAEVLAIARLLHTKYNIRRRIRCFVDLPSNSNRRALVPWAVPIDSIMLQMAERKDAQNRSTLHTVQLLVRSCQNVLGKAERWGAATLAVLLSGGWMWHLFPLFNEFLCYADWATKQSATLRATPSFLEFAKEALMGGSNGALLACTVLGSAIRDAAFVCKDALSCCALRSYYYALTLETMVALSKLDYVPECYWELPGDVHNALGVATSFNLNDIDSAVSGYMMRLRAVVMCMMYPAECAFLWACHQGMQYVKVAWDRMVFLRGFTHDISRSVDGIGRKIHEESAATSDSTTSLCCTSAISPHYALILLLSIADAAPSLCEVALQTHMPSWPHPYVSVSREVCDWVLQTSQRECRHNSMSNNSASTGCARCHFLSKRFLLETIDTSSSTQDYATGPIVYDNVFYKSLNFLRLSGWEEVAVNVSSRPSSHQPHHLLRWVWDVFMDNFFAIASTAPLLTTLGLFAQLNSRLLQLSPTEAEAVAEEIDSVTTLCEPFEHGWVPKFDYEGHATSPYLLDVYLQTRRYNWCSDYSESMHLLNTLQCSTPSIDGRHWYDSRPLPLGSWAIEFKNVCFRYPCSRQFALKNVSFLIKAGETVGIIGFSGAGKTTIALLISRIYAPQSGVILLNEHPIEQYAARELRRRLANAWQESNRMRFLETLSIRDNVALGNLLEGGDGAISRALRLSQSTEFVENRGRGQLNRLFCQELSGGEVERLSIARAFMHSEDTTNAYLLDEPTSAVDSVTERRILASLQRHSARCERPLATVIIITHRLSSIQQANHIIVMNHGEVVEQGSWSELVGSCPQKNPCFHTLLEAQGASSCSFWQEAMPRGSPNNP